MIHPKLFQNLFSLIFVSPILLYIGYKRRKTPKQLFVILLALGLIILFDGIFKYRYNKSIPEKRIFNLVYILFLAPLLISLGLYGRKSSVCLFSALFVFAVLYTLYHIITILKLSVLPKPLENLFKAKE